MFERFTDKGRKIIILAREEAERHQNDYLGTEHLVLAILRESDGIALMILKKMGLRNNADIMRYAKGHEGRDGVLSTSVLLVHHGLHLDIRIDRAHAIGRDDAEVLAHRGAPRVLVARPDRPG